MNEYDIFFLSYDEPNAEAHWADLLDKAPWAQRIHGVKGFEAVHRRAAELSQTDHFITVDADNVVLPKFFETPAPKPASCLSYAGLNTINGLRYGNGGVKVWNREFVLNGGAGHEATDDDRHAVDFCWQDGYEHSSDIYSEVSFGSLYQAYRVGFREGVKLSLDRGMRVEPRLMATTLHPFNLRNLRIWCSVGSHAEFGDYAMLGACQGWASMLDMDFDHRVIRDFSWFDNRWAEMENDFYFVELECKNARYAIETQTGIELHDIDPHISKFIVELTQ